MSHVGWHKESVNQGYGKGGHWVRNPYHHVYSGGGGGTMSSKYSRGYRGAGWRRKYGSKWKGKMRNRFKGQGYQRKEKKIFELFDTYAIPLATVGVTGGDTGASSDGLFFPVQGTGEINRIGRRVTITDIQIKIFITEAEEDGAATAAAAMSKAQPSQIFIALIQDKCTNNAKYSNTNLVYADAGQSGDTAGKQQCMDPMRMLKNVDRFRVLATRVVRTPLATIAEDSTDATTVFHLSSTHTNVIPIFLKVRIPVLFSANGGAIADVVDNSFHIICWADQVGHAPFIHVISRFRFVE